MDFWEKIAAQLVELRDARTPDDVVRILGKGGEGVSSSEAFFAGSGGDDTVLSSLLAAGWIVYWMEAQYYYVVSAPDDAGFITYCEGDIDRGDLSPV